MIGYTDTLRRWAADLRRSGIIDDPDGTGEVGLEAHEAGRRLAVRFTLKLKDDRVADVRFQVFGCGFTIAACAAAADLVADSQIEAAEQVDAGRVNDLLGGLPEERNYCADLAVEALQAALKSCREGQTVETAVPAEEEHGARVSADHPVYSALIDSPKPGQVTHEDRHLFACLLAVADDEPFAGTEALGLSEEALNELRNTFFPCAERIKVKQSQADGVILPEVNPDILSILLSHVPDDAFPVARHLAHILAARAAHAGHLWVAMGLFERPQLTAAIRRHLPSLAEANNQGMRWKRYLFKQVCDMNGGTMCKVPNCGECSDYSLCFVED